MMGRGVVWVTALALSAGCLGRLGGGPAPVTRYYALTAPAAAAGVEGSPAIAVEELRADAPYDDRRIVYRTGRHRVAYDEDDQWVAAPGSMVADSLRRAYQASGRFGMVLAEPGTDTAAIMGGRVLAFEEVDRGRQPRVAHIVLDLELRDAETGRILWSRRADQRIEVARPTRDALAAALSRALSRIAAETAGEIAAAARSSTPPAGKDARRSAGTARE
jgi:ABC-type uncharacterized transport system auxiliary subunit